MRYSFHGKVRATGQQVDGFVEAANAAQAIDRLADRGIIGVYTVRPEPKLSKKSVYLTGEAEPEEQPAPPQQRPRLEQQRSSSSRSNVPAVAKPQVPAPQQLTPQPPSQTDAMMRQLVEKLSSLPTLNQTNGADVVMGQLVEKLSSLLVQVEKVLSRPQQVVYQSGPVRGGQTGKKSNRIPNDVQNNTLRDIFQTNLDLRHSLEKLATTVGPPVLKAVVSNGSANGAANGLPPGTPAMIPNGETSPPRDLPMPAREPVANGRDLSIKAQPAA